MDDGEPDRDALSVVGETLIKETVGLAVFLAVMWYAGPGRQQIRALWQRVQNLRRRGAGTEEAEVAGLRRDMSRWEHEQAQEPDRAPAPGGCGCG